MDPDRARGAQHRRQRIVVARAVQAARDRRHRDRHRRRQRGDDRAAVASAAHRLQRPPRGGRRRVMITVADPGRRRRSSRVIAGLDLGRAAQPARVAPAQVIVSVGAAVAVGAGALRGVVLAMRIPEARQIARMLAVRRLRADSAALVP